MVDRPLEDARPLGPFLSVDDGQDNPAQQRPSNDGNLDVEYDDPLVETAEKWYNSISKEENKRKMMRNYLRSVSDLSNEEVEDKLDKVGL